MKLKVFLYSILTVFIFTSLLAFFYSDFSYKKLREEKEASLIVYMNDFNLDKYTLDYNGAVLFSSHLDGAEVYFLYLDGTLIASSEEENPEIIVIGGKDVVDAMAKGEGYNTVKSDNIKENTLYYCVQERSLESSITYLVRIGVPVTSISGFFIESLPLTLAFLFIGFIICGILSSLLVNSVLKPVKEAIEEDKETKNKYQELKPILDTIQKNKAAIENEIEGIKSDKRLESIVLDNMEHGIIILDNNNSIILVNNVAVKLMDIDKEANSIMYLKGDKEIKDAVAKNESSLFYRRIEGKDYAIRTTASEGAKVILLTDVTEIKRVERSKNDFIANVTHEMNTPLTSIKGFAELINSGSLNEEKAKHASDVIIKQADRLSLLIKNIINYSSIETDDLPPYEVNVSDIILNILQNLEVTMKEKNITLYKDIEDNVKVLSRAEIIQEIVNNLVMNAIKYNKNPGSITISLKKKEKIVVLKVEDTGIGIAKENYDKIFDRFFTVDKSHNEYTSGFGLGLAIVKKICRQSSWPIKVDSTLDKGTSFTIEMK
ncbi:MAG: hypothetical protein H6687_01300 [Bacillales bacterium]|nr:hypothetical protein [Bacillales bacterium]